MCIPCNEFITLEQIWLHCVDLAKIWRRYFLTCSLTPLFQNTSAEDIFAFLEEMNVFHQLLNFKLHIEYVVSTTVIVSYCVLMTFVRLDIILKCVICNSGCLSWGDHVRLTKRYVQGLKHSLNRLKLIGVLSRTISTLRTNTHTEKSWLSTRVDDVRVWWTWTFLKNIFFCKAGHQRNRGRKRDWVLVWYRVIGLFFVSKDTLGHEIESEVG